MAPRVGARVADEGRPVAGERDAARARRRAASAGQAAEPRALRLRRRLPHAADQRQHHQDRLQGNTTLNQI